MLVLKLQRPGEHKRRDWHSWNPLIRTRLFRISRYFELKTISLGFALQLFTISYFELQLFRTPTILNYFLFPLTVRISGIQLYLEELSISSFVL